MIAAGKIEPGRIGVAAATRPAPRLAGLARIAVSCLQRPWSSSTNRPDRAARTGSGPVFAVATAYQPGKAKLLRLLLDVLVIERGAVGRRADARADFDGDLLERRSLDRRQELERRRRCAFLPGSRAGGRRRPAGRLAGSVQPLIRYGPVAPLAALRTSQPFVLAMKATKRLASSGCSVVLAM